MMGNRQNHQCQDGQSNSSAKSVKKPFDKPGNTQNVDTSQSHDASQSQDTSQSQNPSQSQNTTSQTPGRYIYNKIEA